MKVTSIESLISFSEGTIIELPDFADGQKFVAKLKRPSLLMLIKQGKIPNALLNTANDLFTDGVQAAAKSKDTGSEKQLADLFDLFDVLCEATFVSPTYKEIKDAGIDLTDEQLLFIFSYTQQGIKAIENFR
ncbi:esterase [Clostridium sp.]|uniref:esterase n=1 Tax=Clostridium sp. TaxID=1506 RepID=UPI0025C6387D|nr:esterase [Clostridium sp.]